MSIKKYFDVKSEAQSLANLSAGEISSQVESPGYHEQDIIKEERYIPQADLSKPENFARYGSAEEYYTQAIKRIYTTYPYDGSLRERLEWENESTYIDLHLFDTKYPRTNGYIIFSANGWGSKTGYPGGYGDSATEEYIFVKGGPNNNPNGMTPYRDQFTGSNYYEPSMNRESNLGVTSSATNYGRLRLEMSGASAGASAAPFLLTLYSGSTGFTQQAIAATTLTSASVADDKWHHYAVTLKQGATKVDTKFYVDGQLNRVQEISASGKGTLQDISGKNLRATLGALVTSPRKLTTPAYAGKLSASLDEFRFWKTQRTSQNIGRYWFTQVGGGVNTDPEPFIETPLSSNVDLGVYFKFNEGITTNTTIDSTVLDYSGRASNGAWTGYASGARNTGSAIVISKAASKEFKDPIIYPTHPDVVSLTRDLQHSGSQYDVRNNAAIYNTLPGWIIQDDSEGDGELRKLTQIISSYFDTLHMQIAELNRLKDVEYVSGSSKPLPFADRLLSSYGLVAPDIFVDADVLEKLADRSETEVYEKSLSEIKDIIYKNIYNNLTYIYKSKGTEKAFRNLIRCFGIDDELVKLSMYADNATYQMRNSRRNVTVADRFVNFNTLTNQNAVIYNATDPANANTVGFITASADLAAGHAVTMEAEVLFPLKPLPGAAGYITTNTISASLFGVHGVHKRNPHTNPTWATNDNVNFQVYAVRDEIDSTNVRFVVTGSGARAKVPYLTSALYENVYDNSRWNLAVKIRPEKYPLSSFVDGATPGNYTIELHGVEADSGEILNEFSVSKTITAPASFMSSSRRCYIGAHRTNFTGAVLQTSDVKMNACRFWLDDLPNSALNAHILDTENYGSLHPHFYAYPFKPSSSYGDVTKFDTLVFNWEFLQNTGSNAAGGFIVADLSSGSATSTTNANTASFGAVGSILRPQYAGSGSFFAASSTSAIDKDFVISSKLNLPENVYSEDMVTVLGAADTELFGPTVRPVNYYFAFEKSMYQVISEEILNYFANLRDFNNLIGAPVNQWRTEYKDLNFMREKFFEKDGVDQLDFDKFYEFYKWFDTSLSVMLQQLVPASANVAEEVRTVIESHILERSKYQRKFPFIDNVGQSDIEGNVDSQTVAQETAQGSPDEFPQGTAFFTNTAFTKRQIGSSNPPASRPWNRFHAPVGYPRTNAKNNDQVYWERYLAKAVDTARTDIINVISSSYERLSNSPVKFGVEGTTAVAGVSKHHNSVVNYVFTAARAWAAAVPGTTTQAKAILVASGSNVEELIKTSEEFYPSFKQRLGFTLSGSDKINTDAVAGPRHAPFSLYSSSVTDGYNAQVVADFAPGVMVTNLHNDFVVDTDIPMQGPFTEEYVGGRFYRHTRLNQKGTDSNTTRGEGFRIDFDNRSTENVKGVGPKSLVILPPNAPHGTIDTSLPTAYRFRDVTAKRPVNIKNIQMRTGSTIIGNYEKNYQIVNSNSRMKNDPFFKDQSFNFALYPETLATRGRFPLYEPDAIPGKSVHFEAARETYIAIGKASNYRTLLETVYQTGMSVSFWFNYDSHSGTPRIFNLGLIRSGIFNFDGLSIFLYNAGGGNIRLQADLLDNTPATTSIQGSTNLAAGTWYHAIVEFPSGSINGTSGANPAMYINNSAETGTGLQKAANWNGLDHLQTGIRLGDHPTLADPYDGYLADVAIFNKVLTSAERAKIYNSGTRSNIRNDIDNSNIKLYFRLGNKSAFGVEDTIIAQTSAVKATLNPSISNALTGGAPINFNNSANNGIKQESPSTPMDLIDFPALGGPLNKPSENTGGNLNFLVPQRTGSDSQESIIVNRYAGSGYEVMSVGYMDPAHGELSVYNAAPYHNLAIIDHGLSGNVPADPLAARTITVVDQIGKNRGLDQLASLRCGKFGADAAFGPGTAPGSTYPGLPSWHKTNSNRKKRMFSAATLGGYYTSSVFDNLFVQHAIPQSEAQYAWVTASLQTSPKKRTIMTLDPPASVTASTMPLVTSSFGRPQSNFVGVQSLVLDAVSGASHTLGFPASDNPYGAYYNSELGIGIGSQAHYLTVLLNNRGGAYGYPTWKQTRVGQTPVARYLRSQNLIGQVVPPAPVPNFVNNVKIGSAPALSANTFVDYRESPINSKYGAVQFYFEDNTTDSNPDNNVTLRTTYGNDLEYFTNNGLNNRLGLEIDTTKPMAYDAVKDYLVGSDLSTVVQYTESIYPAARNMYSAPVRSRTQYNIDNIWNDNRQKRSEYLKGGYRNLGYTRGLDPAPLSRNPGNYNTQSVWPLDGHNNFTTTGSTMWWDGAGLLQNPYQRFSYSYAIPDTTDIIAAPMYAYRVNVGYQSNTTKYYPILAGDSKWDAATYSGKNPYQNYSSWAEQSRLAAQNSSLLPEFRITEHLETYINQKESNFLADLNNLYEISGTTLANSSHPKFFRTYSNTDFMKYFDAIDGDLNDERSGDLKITRDRLKLKASGLIKFLPYKGFYPAERTTEMALQLSSSIQGLLINPWAADKLPNLLRIAMEPLFAPGIMFNTIKSGIAVSYPILVNTGSNPASPRYYENTLLQHASKFGRYKTNDPAAPSGLGFENMLALSASLGSNRGYVVKQLPFEAMAKPAKYYNDDYLANLTTTTSVYSASADRKTLYDTGTTYASRQKIFVGGAATTYGQNAAIRFGKLAGATRLYEYAMDNFLCETTNFFLDDLVGFQSAREEEFKPVVSGSTYSMQLDLYRTLKTVVGGGVAGVATSEPDRDAFEMYNRISGFGFPMRASDDPSNTAARGSFSHLTPSYYAGVGSAIFTFVARYDGVPTLDEILAQTTITYERDEYQAFTQDWTTGTDPVQQIDSSFNLTELLSEVPDGTTQQKKRWLIQSKFETPILNFANSSYSVAPSASVFYVNGSATTPPNQFIHKGMWNQYGVIPTGNSGVFAQITEGPDVAGATAKSLADIVGFGTGTGRRVGSLKKDAKLEEAIIAVPYKVRKNRRQFFKVNRRMRNTAMFRNLTAAMNKYVFPPKFDFLRHDTVDPVLTYVFEFSVDITQEDIADMWQNLPPDIESRLTEQEVIVEDRELLNLMASTSEKIEWMVFKVKKRAKKDYEKYRRSLVTDNTDAFPETIPDYTYNWPYDYFSLVELANIEATAQWTSKDMQYEISENDAGDLDGRPPATATAEIESQPGATNRRAPSLQNMDPRLRRAMEEMGERDRRMRERFSRDQSEEEEDNPPRRRRRRRRRPLRRRRSRYRGGNS